MAEIGNIPPPVPAPSIRPQQVPAEERDKKRRPPQDEQQQDEAPQDESQQSDEAPGKEEDGKPHIDVYV